MTIGKRKRYGFMMVAALILLIAFGIPFTRHLMSHESTDDAFIDGHITLISPRVSGHVLHVYVKDNQKVKKGDLLVDLDRRGHEIRLASASATYESTHVSLQMRKLDEELSMIASQSKMDDATAVMSAAQAKIEAADSQVNTANSQCKEIRVKIDIAHLELEQARSEMKAIKAEHVRNQSDLKRYKELVGTGTITQQQLDHMETAVRMSEANLEAAQTKVQTKESMILQYKAALAVAQDQISQAKAQVKACQAQCTQAKAGILAAEAGPKQVTQSRSMASMAKADLEKAEAGVEQAKLDLSYTKIYAESDGFVTNKSVEAGSFVQVGQPLMALVSAEVWITANFKETQLTDMKPGQPVGIKVDAYPGVALKGYVDSIQHGTGSRFSLLPAQNATGNFVKVVQRVPVKILFDKNTPIAEYNLVPGMSVSPEVDISATPSKEASLSLEYSGDIFSLNTIQETK